MPDYLHDTKLVLNARGKGSAFCTLRYVLRNNMLNFLYHLSWCTIFRSEVYASYVSHSHSM
jgi:hypothetical protein